MLEFLRAPHWNDSGTESCNIMLASSPSWNSGGQASLPRIEEEEFFQTLSSCLLLGRCSPPRRGRPRSPSSRLPLSPGHSLCLSPPRTHLSVVKQWFSSVKLHFICQCLCLLPLLILLSRDGGKIGHLPSKKKKKSKFRSPPDIHFWYPAFSFLSP